MLLFKVENTFMLSSNGLALTPGVGYNVVRAGDALKLIRPDNSVLQTKIKAIAFEPNRSIIIESNIKKEDVPIGTEVWLVL